MINRERIIEICKRIYHVWYDAHLEARKQGTFLNRKGMAVKTKENELLNGNIYRLLVKLALPLIAGDVLQQFYNTIDAVIIGKFVGNDAFAAIGVAGTIMNVFLFSIIGFCVGTTAIFSQYYGQKNMEMFRKEMYLVVLPGSVVIILISVLSVCTISLMLPLMQTPQRLIPYVREYLVVILGGLLISYLYNILNGILQSIGNTTAVLIFLAVSIIGNVVLDYTFVGIFAFGIKGAAIATCLAQFISALLAIIFIKRKYPNLIFKRNDMVIQKDMVGRTLYFGIATMLHQAGLYIGKMLVQGAVNTLGIFAISAYTATTRIEGFINSFATSGAQAISILSGQNLGAGLKVRVRNTFKSGIILLSALGAALSIVLYLGAGTFMNLLNSNAGAEEIHAGIQYLQWVSVFYIFNYIGSAFGGFFRGVGKVDRSCKGTVIQMSARVILTFLVIKKLNLPGVALATGIGWIMIVTYFGLQLRRDNKNEEWQTQKRIASE